MSAGLPSSLIHVVVVLFVVVAVADDVVVVTVLAVVVVVATSCYSLINAALSATFIVDRPLTACDKPSELETLTVCPAPPPTHCKVMRFSSQATCRSSLISGALRVVTS